MSIEAFRKSSEYANFKACDVEERAKHLRNTKQGLALAIGVMFIACIFGFILALWAFSGGILPLQILGVLLAIYTAYVLVRFSITLLPPMLDILNSHDFRSVALIMGGMVADHKIVMTDHVKTMLIFALVEEDEQNDDLTKRMAIAASKFTKSEVGPIIGRIKDFDIHDYIIVVNKETGESKKLIYQGHHDTDPIGEFNKMATKDGAVPKIGFVVQKGDSPSGVYYMEE